VNLLDENIPLEWRYPALDQHGFLPQGIHNGTLLNALRADIMSESPHQSPNRNAFSTRLKGFVTRIPATVSASTGIQTMATLATPKQLQGIVKAEDTRMRTN
jgi:hypothetical protein